MSKEKFFNFVPTGNGRASVMLYGPIGGGKDGVSAEQVASELGWLENEFPVIDIHINSQGGEVFAGIAIFNAIKECRSTVNIYVDGLAASIAGIIALCGKPLHMSRYSRLMLHSVSGGCEGDARDMRKCADLIEGLEGTLADMISRKCGMPSEQVKETYFDGTDHWFTAEEALRAKLCDDIYDLAGADALGSNPTNEQIYQFTNRILLNKQSSNNKEMEFIDKMKALDTFKDLTEAEILAKVKSLTNEAAKAEALQNRVTQLEAENKASKAAAVDAFLNQAVSEGRIKAEQLDNYKKLMDADPDATKALINSMPKAESARINQFIGSKPTGDPADLANMSWNEIDKAGRLGELKDKFPELFEQKFREEFGPKE